MFQAKSVDIIHDVANIDTENFKEDATKLADTIVYAGEKLKDMKQILLEQNEEDLNKNDVDLVNKTSKHFTAKKSEMINFSPSILFKLINCKNFTNALNKTEELLQVSGLVSIAYSQSLTVISNEIEKCAKKDPYPRVFCQLGLLGVIYEQGEVFEQIAANFTHYAASSVKTIVRDMVSCFKH